MAEVMKQRCTKRNSCSAVVAAIKPLGNNTKKTPRHMKYAHGVRETTVGRTRKHKLREAELANSTKPLKLCGLDEIPDQSL
jgi:hypothetical protein